MDIINALMVGGTIVGGIISVCFTYLKAKKLETPATDKDINKLYRDVAVLKAKLEAIEKSQDQVQDQLSKLHDILLRLLDE
jgi:outer membrane murein-binding lipoprotein Lpp